MPSLLITGRNGFIGSHLAPLLKQKNAVISIIRQRNPDIDYSNEKIIQKDIGQITEEDLRPYKIDKIVHLAAQTRGRGPILEKNNLLISNKIFFLARELKIPVIYISSTNALFGKDLGSYTRSKILSELQLKKELSSYAIIRIPLVLGKNSPTTATIKSFYKKFNFFPLFGPQEGKIQPVDIQSLVTSLAKIIEEKDPSGQIINLVGEESFSWRAVIEYAINSKNKTHFTKFPLGLALGICRFLETLRLPFPISSEEIKSVNMDKIVTKEQSSLIINNPFNLLFPENITP